MKYFEFRDNTAYEKQWTYAAHIEPRSRVVSWRCPECGRAASYPSGELDVVLEGGSGFPDFLCCGAYPLLIVSERVIRAWKDNGIECFLAYAVGIAGVEESEVKKELAPPYYRVEITGQCRIDVVRSGGRITRMCNRCAGFQTEPPVVRRMALFPGSWDGSDLFRDHVLFPRVTLCTARVADLMKRHGFRNLRLEEGEEYGETGFIGNHCPG